MSNTGDMLNEPALEDHMGVVSVTLRSQRCEERLICTAISKSRSWVLSCGRIPNLAFTRENCRRVWKT